MSKQKSLKDRLPKIGKDKGIKTEKEKFEERREEVLAKGRKFKYPMQFAKHRLVFVTIAIAIIALVLAGFFGWFALYKSQSTGDVLYRLTTVLPISVAKIDGEDVKYSDYLMIYRSSISPVIQQNGELSTGIDDENLQNTYKRFALDAAEDYTYAIKLARQLGIEVTDEMIDKSFDEHRKIGGTDRSKENFLNVLDDNFGLSESEYRRMLYLSLIKSEVAKRIDAEANKKAEEVRQKVLTNGGDFKAAADELGVEFEETGGLIDVMNVDGGRSNVAYGLEPGKISETFLSLGGDAYYIVKLNEKSDSRVNYASLRIPFTEFEKRLKNVREENRVEEFIEIPTTESESAEMSDEAAE